jgi:hypothetical protein
VARNVVNKNGVSIYRASDMVGWMSALKEAN